MTDHRPPRTAGPHEPPTAPFRTPGATTQVAAPVPSPTPRAPGEEPATTAIPAQRQVQKQAQQETQHVGEATGRPTPPAPEPHARLLLVPLLIGALVAVALGVYGRVHPPSGYAVGIAGFSGLGYAKAWLSTATLLFGLLNLISAMIMYGKVVLHPPEWISGLHRWSGRIAVLVSVPVAVQCLYALGLQTGSTRVLVHSVVGCVFYGAFTAKMLSLSRAGLPRWAIPVLGGLVFTGLVLLWLTSALWLFTTQGLHL